MRIPSIRPGRIASAIAAIGMTVSLAATPAYADSRVVATIGADLTPAQQQTVIDYFGSNMNGAEVIYVTNADEHAHLDGYVPYEQIGNETYSCALICPTTSGGIRVRAANLNYVTADMLASALSSAGVRNADVIAICPFKVSGTGALTGVLLAYETATGQPLDQAKKDVATQELVVTQTISNQVGSDAATLIVNDVKAGVIMNGVTDESQIDAIVETTVNNVVNNTTINNVTNVDNSTTVIDNSTVEVTEVTINTTPGLSDEDIAALKELARSYAAADYNYDDMAETLANVSQNASASSGIADPMADELADAAAAAQDGTAGTADTTDTSAAADTAGDADATGATTGTEPAPGTTPASEEPDTTTAADAPAEPAEAAAPSIFDGTDNEALGDDVSVTATDEGASTDTEGTETGELTGDPNGSADADTADAALPEPPTPAYSADVVLTALATARASDLVDGTAFVVFEENGQYGLANMVDGTHLTDPVYTNAFQATDGLVVATQATDGTQVLLDAQGKQLLGGSYGEVRVLNENWVLGIQRGLDGSPDTVDVYYLPGSTTMPAASTTSDVLADARANGDYLNTSAPDGTLSAYGVNFTPVDGAAPAAIDDFSYADDAGVGSSGEDAAEPSSAEIAVTQPLEGAQDTQDVQPSEDTAAADEQVAAGMAAGDEQAVSLPQGAVMLEGTQGPLYTATAADGTTHLFDASGLDLFDRGFDQVIPTHDGTAVVLVDKTSNAAWAFEVKVPSALQ